VEMPKDNIASFFLPYCLREVEDGRWLLLNRHYKPVGFMTKGFVDYENPPVPVSVKFKRPLSAATIKALSVDGASQPRDPDNSGCDAPFIFLYHDGCPPHREPAAYLSRLKRLMKLRVVEPDEPYVIGFRNKSLGDPPPRENAGLYNKPDPLARGELLSDDHPTDFGMADDHPVEDPYADCDLFTYEAYDDPREAFMGLLHKGSGGIMRLTDSGGGTVVWVEGGELVFHETVTEWEFGPYLEEMVVLGVPIIESPSGGYSAPFDDVRIAFGFGPLEEETP
jgi:hypothetical protein